MPRSRLFVLRCKMAGSGPPPASCRAWNTTLICLQSFHVYEAELRQRGVGPTSRVTKRPKQRRGGSAAQLTTLDVRCLTWEPVISIQYRRKDEYRHIMTLPTIGTQQTRSRNLKGNSLACDSKMPLTTPGGPSTQVSRQSKFPLRTIV